MDGRGESNRLGETTYLDIPYHSSNIQQVLSKGVGSQHFDFWNDRGERIRVMPLLGERSLFIEDIKINCYVHQLVGRYKALGFYIVSILGFEQQHPLNRSNEGLFTQPMAITILTHQKSVYLFGRGSVQQVRIKMMMKFPHILFMV